MEILILAKNLLKTLQKLRIAKLVQFLSKKSEKINQYCQTEFGDKNLSKIKNLNFQDLTELISCFQQKGLEIKFDIDNSTICLTTFYSNKIERRRKTA
jgi:hypothetical protein